MLSLYVRKPGRDPHMRIREQKDANSRRSGSLVSYDASLPHWIRIAKTQREHLIFTVCIIAVPLRQETRKIAENLMGKTFPERYRALFISLILVLLRDKCDFLRITDIPSEEECE